MPVAVVDHCPCEGVVIVHDVSYRHLQSACTEVDLVLETTAKVIGNQLTGLVCTQLGVELNGPVSATSVVCRAIRQNHWSGNTQVQATLNLSTPSIQGISQLAGGVARIRASVDFCRIVDAVVIRVSQIRPCPVQLLFFVEQGVTVGVQATIQNSGVNGRIIVWIGASPKFVEIIKVIRIRVCCRIGRIRWIKSVGHFPPIGHAVTIGIAVGQLAASLIGKVCSTNQSSCGLPAVEPRRAIAQQAVLGADATIVKAEVCEQGRIGLVNRCSASLCHFGIANTRPDAEVIHLAGKAFTGNHSHSTGGFGQ